MAPRHPRVGIKDVAQLAGVSVGTVSNVLNRPSSVSDGRKAAVEAAIVELGYVPDHAARQLKGVRSQLIGYLFPNPLNPYYSNLADGIEREAERRGLDVLTANTRGQQHQHDHYLSLFERQLARGIIVAVGNGDLSRELALSRRGTPMVLASAHAGDGLLCSVGSDDVAGGELALAHLVTSGCRRIVVMMARGLAASERRWAGARAAAEKHRVRIELVPVSELSVDAGRIAMQDLLARPAGERPDAVFAVSDLVALGALLAVVADGRLRVPRDVSLVGYDDLPYAASALVALTSIRQHEEQIGGIAVGMIEHALADPHHEHSHVLLDPVLVRRESTRG